MTKTQIQTTDSADFQNSSGLRGIVHWSPNYLMSSKAEVDLKAINGGAPQQIVISLTQFLYYHTHTHTHFIS